MYEYDKYVTREQSMIALAIWITCCMQGLFPAIVVAMPLTMEIELHLAE